MHFVASVILYGISSLLVLIATLQRSRGQELFREIDSFLLPFFTLVGFLIMYLLLRLVPKNILNILILIFFVATGYFSLTSNFLYLFEFSEYKYEKSNNEKINTADFHEIYIKNNQKTTSSDNGDVNKKQNHPFVEYLYNLYKEITLEEIFIYFLALILVLIYVFTQNWISGNIITISICFHTIRELRLDSVRTGVILLLIMLLYDILWLFFGKNIDQEFEGIDVPIKLVFPRHFRGYDMIGMGDIFTPGLYITIVRDFCKRKKNGNNSLYWWTFVSFNVGLIISLIGLWNFGETKISILFICPIMFGGSLLYATYNSFFIEFIRYKVKE